MVVDEPILEKTMAESAAAILPVGAGYGKLNSPIREQMLIQM